jgi:hypothetical protein
MAILEEVAMLKKPLEAIGWQTNEIVLGQCKVDEKSNEITAIPELLKILAISGCIVTIDTMGTHTRIAQTVMEALAGQETTKRSR